MADSVIEGGFYFKKQVLLNDRLISWSHRSRFDTALALARKYGPRKLLDYGCGDGTLLAMLSGENGLETGVGCELDPRVVVECRRRFNSTKLKFIGVDEADTPQHASTYDLVFCMEVLEHVVAFEQVIDRLRRLLAPDGRLIVSVPVEVGPALVVKQTARRIAGWRRLGDYQWTTAYSWAEMAASVFARSRQHITRPVYRGKDGAVFHDHKGFNWKLLRSKLSESFQLEHTVASPIAWLPPGLSSQVWFVLRHRPH